MTEHKFSAVVKDTDAFREFSINCERFLVLERFAIEAIGTLQALFRMVHQGNSFGGAGQCQDQLNEMDRP